MPRPLEQCGCGQWYPQGGAALCAANRHGQKEGGIAARHHHLNVFELSTEAFCAECGSKLSTDLKLEADGRLVLRVLPHICAVEEPAEIIQEVAA